MSHPFPLQKQSLCFLSDLVEHVRVLGFLVPAELCLAANIAPFDLLHVRRAGPTREGRLAEERCTPAQAAPASFEFSGSQSTADCLDLPPRKKQTAPLLQTRGFAGLSDLQKSTVSDNATFIGVIHSYSSLYGRWLSANVSEAGLRSRYV